MGTCQSCLECDSCCKPWAHHGEKNTKDPCKTPESQSKDTDTTFCIEVDLEQALILRELHKEEETRSAEIEHAIKLQRMFRGFLLRSKLARLAKAVAVLQATVRKHLANTRYKRQLEYCLVLQRWSRSLLAQRKLQRRRRHLKATQIQSIWRATWARTELNRQRSAVVRVQALTRGTTQRCAFKRECSAVVVIQRISRGFLSRSSYTRSRQCSVVVQAMVRMLLARMILKRQKEAVVKLQSSLRWMKQQRLYAIQSSKIVEIQRVARGCSSRRMQARSQKAAVIIQAEFRKCYAQEFYKRHLETCVVLQRWIRCVRARNNLKQRKRSHNAVLLQANWRMRSAAFTLKRKRKAATKLQAEFRTYHARELYKIKRDKCVMLQCWIRYKKGKNDFMRRRRIQSVVLLQAFWRMVVVASILERKREAAILIQSTTRGARQRDTLRQKMVAATKIQSLIRGYMWRESFDRERSAAIPVQAMIRSYVARRRYHLLLNRFVVIQCWWRRCCAKRELSHLHFDYSARKVQSTWRVTCSKAALCASLQKSAVQVQAGGHGRCQLPSHQEEETEVSKIQRAIGVILEPEKSDQVSPSVMDHAVYESNMTWKTSATKQEEPVTFQQSVHVLYVEEGNKQTLLHQQAPLLKIHSKENDCAAKSQTADIVAKDCKNKLANATDDAALATDARKNKNGSDRSEFLHGNPARFSKTSHNEHNSNLAEPANNDAIGRAVLKECPSRRSTLLKDHNDDHSTDKKEGESLISEISIVSLRYAEMLDRLKHEVLKLRTTNTALRYENKKCKDNQLKLVEASKSTGATFTGFVNHAKELNAKREKLMSENKQLTTEITEAQIANEELKEELNMKQASYIAEVHARMGCKKALEDIVDACTERCKDPNLIDSVLEMSDKFIS